MCGITLCLRRANSFSSELLSDSPEWAKLMENNKARGPDVQSREDITISFEDDPKSKLSISFVASTLHLRGPKPVAQPHMSDKYVLCWNGEVFEGLEFPGDQNDGLVLFEALKKLQEEEDIYSFMSSIEGPYAFALYQRDRRYLIFARDPLGRRSLLIHRPTPSQPYLLVSSASAGTQAPFGFEEVDPRYFYCLDISRLGSFANNPAAFDEALVLKERAAVTSSSAFKTLARVNETIPIDPPMVSLSDPLPHELASAIDRFFEVLDQSVRIRVQNIPPPFIPGSCRLAVLFSGGIDSTMMAFLADRHVPPNEPIDLLNVAFQNPRKIRGAVQPSKKKVKKVKESILPLEEDNDKTYNVPDRLGGLDELEELRKLCPNRRWNFVEVNIAYEESSQLRSTIEDIMFPSRTVMDLSLALALYFAARGIGQVRSSPGAEPQPYTSPARVLLNGLGSDELLGGYGRHRSAYNTGGWKPLIEELQLELDRIPSRNLGRDDRVISCHGKETRHPFLSLSVVEFVANLPVHLKMDGRLEIGLGDKLLLRLLSLKQGLELAAKRKKRAMQFGSHSARMEIGTGEKDGDKLLSAD
ncbi:hypothetical protein M422DRAFT_250803 [Sphaerobolus stellatus SS14]|uniref:Glutamine amidotransferase type-2 domain-containing protein n=1 Tax=Sphaerobolus stellatus (strain SS14) TaxID=990650 RepID=A0A0C9VER3_SPHS4|nr:hypothetical protein M422DRAFT_250803 [Sphaerobolus stellatus SS14]